MAQATIESPMSGKSQSSTAAAIFRNDDPLTKELRDGAALGFNDISRLNRATSPAYEALSWLGPPSNDVFSAQDDPTITKPTSTGTPYQNNVYKGKATASHASWLSVAHGSGSEAEAELQAASRDALVAMGDWTAGILVPDETLKGSARAKSLDRRDRKRKFKKPLVKIIQHIDAPKASHVLHDPNQESTVTIPASLDGPDKTRLCRRATQHDDNQLRLAEEGHIRPESVSKSSRRPLSPTRIYLLTSNIVFIVLVVALSSFGAHQTGKHRIACTKGIVFGATVLVACFTVLAMIVARRAPQEAFLAGLLEIGIGFTLLSELDDFM
ncbi:hypothetical protein EJ02DRAFT_38822 [Clathrospora elynae]|uniref:Uncharacterized protein n=1 Tax=Clathrospora elynae TaxID=706981 RepID=A0A6A5SDF5_9PLEO|nr:hypothetical protein EJ02DRAFT_38822 [Clathrospora elynae]